MSATLTSLRIRNLALVEALFWEPPGGFVAITGETGAGKSVILGAIKLLLGERADKSLIRSGADACTVEGVFMIPSESPLHEILSEGGADSCEGGQLIIKRVVSTAGTGRQFLNASACPLSLLKQIGDLLVDLHGPHDHQSLFSRDQQLLVLDVESAALQPGEEEQLLSKQRTAANAHRLCAICSEMSDALINSDEAIASRWTDVSRLAKELQRLDSSTQNISLAVSGIFESLQDLSRDLDRYASTLNEDPQSLTAIDDRLDAIQSLKRKYGSTVEAVIAFGNEAASKLAHLRQREERGAGLDEEIARAKASLDEASKKLSKIRKQAAPKLEDLVKHHLNDLGFARAGLSIQFEELLDPAPLGCEQIDFLFAPNPGEPERALRMIASSGEISRVMLALKTSLAAQDSVPILVFDEIDANVGGEIGAMVGAKMKELGLSHQVFCITHLPQVAAGASSQYVVTKETSGDRTRTRLTETTAQSRITEIARMLGGKLDSARSHAEALLSGK
ncbi:MAG: DNA repair protein RecN [Verrucomicrobia bacterium]|nr:DNA repair protein RecN [Verrucomicrobiota bacterium]